MERHSGWWRHEARLLDRPPPGADKDLPLPNLARVVRLPRSVGHKWFLEPFDEANGDRTIDDPAQRAVPTGGRTLGLFPRRAVLAIGPAVVPR